MNKRINIRLSEFSKFYSYCFFVFLSFAHDVRNVLLLYGAMQRRCVPMTEVSHTMGPGKDAVFL